MTKYTILIAHLISNSIVNIHNIFPKPAELKIYGDTTIILDNYLNIEVNTNSPRLLKATIRYEELINKEKYSPIVPLFKLHQPPPYYSPVLNSLSVSIENDRDIDFNLNTDESYTIEILPKLNTAKAIIKAKTVYGAIHGLESFSQLVKYDKYSKTRYIPSTPLKIKDKPKYSHRGVLIDTNRNWMSVKAIKGVIDAMSYNKLNVLHWHILDSNDFNFKSKKHPKLWKSMKVVEEEDLYTYEIIQELVEYGLDRAVRIIPEVEAPGHSYSIGKAYPDLGTTLDEDDWRFYGPGPPSGQLDPTNSKSSQIVKDLIDEFAQLFPDSYLHLSGDEINNNSWNSSESIRKYMKRYNVTFDDLFKNFNYQMQVQAKKNNKSIIVWQEALLKHNCKLPSDALVQVWLGASDAKKIIELGHNVLASSNQHWYLDCGHGTEIGNYPTGKSWCDPYKHWQIVYSYDLVANLTAEQAKKVKGGEVAAWGEQIDEQVIEKFLWPRASAASEVLWTGNRDGDKIRSTKHVLPRLNDWRFRMVGRGIGAEPLQPLWCVKNPYRCDLN